MPFWEELPRLFFLVILLLIGLSDARDRRIPNALLLGLLSLALLSLLLFGRSVSGIEMEWPGVGLSVLAVLLLSVPGYLGRQLGAGDIKLLLVFPMVFSIGQLLPVMVLAYAGLALTCIIWRRKSLPFAPFMATFSFAVILGVP